MTKIDKYLESNSNIDKNMLTNDLVELTKDYRLHKSMKIEDVEYIKVTEEDRTVLFNDLDYVKKAFVDKIKNKNILSEIEEVKMKNNSFLNKIRRFFKIQIK